MERRAHVGRVRRRITGLIGALVVLPMAWAVVGAGVATAQTGAVDVQKQQIAALDRGDVAAVMALFAPDATYEAGSCIPKACVGTAAIQAEIGREVVDHLQVTVLGATGSADTATGSVSITSDSIRAVPGVRRILATFVENTRDGLTASVVTRPDLTDPQTVAFIRAKAAARSPAALAFTGSDPEPLVLTGILLVLAGVVFGRATRRRRSYSERQAPW